MAIPILIVLGLVLGGTYQSEYDENTVYVAGGGFLAMLRTQTFSYFFTALIPIGMIMWLTGVIMRWRQTP